MVTIMRSVKPGAVFDEEVTAVGSGIRPEFPDLSGVAGMAPMLWTGLWPGARMMKGG